MLLDMTTFRQFNAAFDLISEAMEKQKRITIFGDYDCDGITGVAQLARFFARHHTQPELMLPHRSRDGYGLKVHQVERCAREGTQLLITVDTGISCTEAIERAKELGMKTIIVDHHRIPAEPAKADAALHPGLDGLPDQPSASTLCFALISACEERMGNPLWEGYEEDLLLSTMGTIADLVPLKGTNRALVRAGLNVLPHIEGHLGLFMERAGVGKGATSRDIAFRLAPRINAAGRMDDPMIALRGLLGEVMEIEMLDQLNEDRQDLVRDLLEKALEKVPRDRSLLALADDTYLPGIVGLLAGKLTEQFGKPSIVAHRNGNICTASLRSPLCYDITAGLTRIGHLLVSFGGHAQAAGCTFETDQMEKVFVALQEDIEQEVDPVLLEPTLQIDAVLDPKMITVDLCRDIETLEPFGQGNSEPRFLVPSVALNDVRVCGSDGSHLQLRVGNVKGIAFRLGHLAKELSPGQPFDIACRLSINEWNGSRNPQLVVEDIRTSVASSVPVTSYGL